MKLVSILTAATLVSYAHALLEPSIRTFEPKTIHISSTMGGVSHIAWTLEIGKVLVQRGHNVSFITDDDSVKFGKPYKSEIDTISMGPNLSKVPFRDLFTTGISLPPSVRKALKEHYKSVYHHEFYSYLEIFENSNTSIAICDLMGMACADAAQALNIPLIIHMTMSNSKDTAAPFINEYFTAGAPTTKNQSFAKRFYNRFILKSILVPRHISMTKYFQKLRDEVDMHTGDGATFFPAMGRHSNAIKLVNSFWGMESPRPVGPFVEYVGPIIGTSYDELPESMAKFMDEHKRVVYTAFGQTYSPSGLEFEALLTGLLEAYESKYFDGFIWSFSMRSRQEPGLPKKITTQSGKVYNVQDLFDGLYADLRFEAWSPQFAILHHPHCSLFISHGGASSIHESLFNGVPLLIHPFASDQPANAFSMQDAGVGLMLDRKALNVTDTVEKIGIILNDKAGTFKSNMNSMQTLVHLRSKRKEYAADVIEEVMYSVRKDGDIWYRKEAVEHMGYFKARNLDVDLAAVFVFISFIYLACKTVNMICIVYTFLFVPHTKKTYKTA